MPAPKMYSVLVLGFPAYKFSARSIGQARAAAWRGYQNYDDRCTFKDFLSLARVTRIEHEFKPILVQGKKAWATGVDGGNSIEFFPDIGDGPLWSHQNDVTKEDWTKTP